MSISKKLVPSYIPYSEKDSPYYGEREDSPWYSKKFINSLFAQGKASHMSASEEEWIYEKTHERIKRYIREYVKKRHASHIQASNLVLRVRKFFGIN